MRETLRDHYLHRECLRLWIYCRPHRSLDNQEVLAHLSRELYKYESDSARLTYALIEGVEFVEAAHESGHLLSNYTPKEMRLALILTVCSRRKRIWSNWIAPAMPASFAYLY